MPHKKIKTPEKFWELFQGYKRDIKKDPILKHVFVGKEGESKYEKREKPLTMVGFECYVMDHTEITYPDLTHYFENTEERYSDFVPIASRIRQEIRNDQLVGGMAMIYSQSITARLNGLAEVNKNVNTNLDIEVTIPEEDIPDYIKKQYDAQ